MTNRYEQAAQEVEARIKELEARIVRYENHPTLHTRLNGVRRELAELKALPLAHWRATGKWAQEIWG